MSTYTCISFDAGNLIALLAFGLTCYNLWATRRHNQLSVKPFLTGHTHKLTTNEGLVYSYEVTNSGVGPAIIKEFQFLRHNCVFPRSKDNDKHYTENLIHEHLGNRFKYTIIHSFSFNPNSCLRAGESRKIAELFFPGVSQSNQKELFEKIQGVELTILYESFYGQRFNFDTRKDSKDS